MVKVCRYTPSHSVYFFKHWVRDIWRGLHTGRNICFLLNISNIISYDRRFESNGHADLLQ